MQEYHTSLEGQANAVSQFVGNLLARALRQD